MTSAISSPCINICELNPEGLCSGCFRTSDEIGRWVFFSEDERERVTQALPKRREEFIANCFD